MGGEMGSSRIEVPRFLPKDRKEAKEEREELREGGLLKLRGGGFLFRRRGVPVDSREGTVGEVGER